MKPPNLTRRTFLAATGSATLGGLAGCATPFSPTAGIIDTHTHFYDPTRPQGVPWPPIDDALLYRPVHPREFEALARPLGVTSTVVVEASPWVTDNAWVLELARSEPFLIGLVGHLKPGQPGFENDLRLFAANPRFRGIRIGLWDVRVTPDRPPFLQDLQRLADRSLALDVLVGPDQLGRVVELASLLPSLRIVIDHCANVRVDGNAPPAAWRKGLDQLAPHRNVFMKASGLVEGTGRSDGTAPSDTAFYQPTLDAVWETFGERRILFGSNWPVSARFASYATTLGIVRDYFAAKGSGTVRRFSTLNAKTAYKLSASA